ncbi:hypothetical protein [Bacillus cereus group sp. TH152-1LC]|uniref:hypothetical protein n=1 Tax=Bacillus cereus group sp. TH152-1LC TaxID=3018060 RepID=UPI0022E17EBA|nr:hypothetical protein [Bacillus cereus group sp. TH152-1LC]MDA1675692.1 hypothetical protein [Bacillus cereus group sp. TH152-1LC]
MLKKPEHIFHITKPQHVESILKNGLIPSLIDGLIYFTTTLEDVITFSNTLRVSAIRDEKDPDKIKQMRVANKLYVIKVSTDSLTTSKCKEGKEHDPNFFKNAIALTYPEKIGPEAIMEIYELNCLTRSLKIFEEGIPEIDENIINI